MYKHLAIILIATIAVMMASGYALSRDPGRIITTSAQVPFSHGLPIVMAQATPHVLFPTQTQMVNYFNSIGAKNIRIDFTNGLTGSASNMEVATQGKNTYVVWQQNQGGNTFIKMAISHNGLESFMAPITLSNSGHSIIPLVQTAGAQTVYAVWQETGQKQIFASLSHDGGNTFRTFDLSNSQSAAFAPDLYQSGTGTDTYALWFENHGGQISLLGHGGW